MSFRVQTNIAALDAYRSLSKTSRALEQVTERLSSGYRINKASDDAAGLAISNRFRADIRSYRVAQRNIAEGLSMIQVAEGAAGNVEMILERMKELSTQAASANATTQLPVIDAEYQSLAAEINRIVAATNYQGTTILDGTFGGTYQIGPTATAADQIVVDLTAFDITTGTLGVAATSLTSQANAQAALTVLDAAIGTVNAGLGRLGAFMNRLDYAASNIATTVLNYEGSESVIRDADMAAEMVNYSKLAILQQTGTSMLAQANTLPQAILSLLQ